MSSTVLLDTIMRVIDSVCILLQSISIFIDFLRKKIGLICSTSLRRTSDLSTIFTDRTTVFRPFDKSKALSGIGLVLDVVELSRQIKGHIWWVFQHDRRKFRHRYSKERTNRVRNDRL